MIFKILDASEHAQIPPEAIGGHTLPEGSLVAVGMEEGRIVAVWCAVTVVHLEPLWIREDRRKSTYILRRLWMTLRNALASLGVKHTLTVISPAVPVTERIASWCGAQRVNGSLYALNVSEENRCPLL